MGIIFDRDSLLAGQKNYTAKVVNAYIVYELDKWPNKPQKNFTSTNCLLGETNIVKNSKKN